MITSNDFVTVNEPYGPYRTLEMKYECADGYWIGVFLENDKKYGGHVSMHNSSSKLMMNTGIVKFNNIEEIDSAISKFISHIYSTIVDDEAVEYLLNL